MILFQKWILPHQNKLLINYKKQIRIRLVRGGGCADIGRSSINIWRYFVNFWAH